MSAQYTIDPFIVQEVPGLKLGILRYNRVTLSTTPKMLQGRINLLMESIRLDYEGKTAADVPGVKEFRTVLKTLGIDPSRYRPSNEALIRRVLQNKPFSWVNSGVDVNNFLSIQFGLPAGLYNMDKIKGDIILRMGEADESYPALNGREISCEGKFFLADEAGPFGSPLVDSVRTSVDDTATNLLHVFFIPPGYDKYTPDQILQSAAEMFTQVNGGTYHIDGYCG
ncbi:B3/B4 domain-containing protein [Aneurinibacillus terranovensis]|uniref:B3/B4 domain-containing protein n=1 Tax=Aneurinibacillus terranovensis TaxID=278991 RepID=UPI000425B993|nr:phenylalanine--tRNA ligase beta subunit-related protein [Aneurinibacillus terranovensis]